MSEEVEKTEMVEQEPEVAKEPEKEPESSADVFDGEPFDAERAKTLITKLRSEVKGLKPFEKKVKQLEQAEQERKDAELSEMERLQKQLSESENKLQRLTYQQMQRKIADEVGLPAVFADRIQGDDEDAMRKDAKSLLEAMPQEKKTVIATTNPGDAKRGVTDDQRRAALYRGDPSDPFDTAAARAHGGGVHFVTDKE